MTYRISLPYCADVSDYFACLRPMGWAAWLDGGLDGVDIMVAQPVATLVTRGPVTEIQTAGRTEVSEQSPFLLLREQLGAAVDALPGGEFAGGALGYWGYDLARAEYCLTSCAKEWSHLPDMAVGIYDWAVVIDHQRQEAVLVSHLRYPDTVQALPQVLQRLTSPAHTERDAFQVKGKVAANFTRDSYRKAFSRVMEYLRQGDCYQINLAQCFSAQAQGDPFAAYQMLRRLSPAPYAAFLDWPQTQILCSSPERFLSVRAGKVETRPIKGTRPRSSDPLRDAKLKEDLRSHPKDRAENLMIVDLLRNDLGKCCRPGTVRTPQLFSVESYANVHHLVSTVVGELRDECDGIEVLRACFPGGSITGAPKQRAMEIIESLEPDRRGVYCGAIGYVGFDGHLETNIAIRTMVYAKGEIRCWAGGGIVAESECEAEYQETLDKASAMLEVLRRCGGALEKS